MKNMLRLALTMVALTAAAACGSDLPSSPISPSAPTPGNNPPPAPPQGPFKQTLSGNVGARATAFQVFVAPRSGSATFKLSWANEANDLEFILTAGSCPDIYGPNATCTYLAAAQELTGTLRTMSATMAAGQSYRIWVDNFGFSAQPFTIEIEIQ
jgi:hypothetical protein